MARDALDGRPGLSGGGWGAFVGDGGIDPTGELLDDGLHESALGVAGSEEGGVGDEEDDGPTREGQEGQQHAQPGGNLQQGDEAHAAVVVLLDEPPQRVGERVRRRLAVGRPLARRREDDRYEVGAEVGRHVEDRVDGERQHGQRNLPREQPDKGHCCVMGGQSKRKDLHRLPRRCHIGLGARRHLPRY